MIVSVDSVPSLHPMAVIPVEAPVVGLVLIHLPTLSLEMLSVSEASIQRSKFVLQLSKRALIFVLQEVVVEIDVVARLSLALLHLVVVVDPVFVVAGRDIALTTAMPGPVIDVELR